MRRLVFAMLTCSCALLPAQSSTCPGSTELGGITSSAGVGGAAGGGRGTIRLYSGPGTVVTSFSQELTLGSMCEMTYQIWEGPSGAGPWSLVDQTIVASQGPGQAEYDSGPMNAPLVPGQYYAIITYASAPSIQYHFVSGAGPAQPGWTYDARIYENGYPPGTFIRSGSADCHQWVCTGGLQINSVDTAPTTVFQGQSGIAVTVEVESKSTSLIDSLVGTLTFFGTADRTAEYTVTPDPGNPSTIAPMGIETLNFAVDVSPTATPENIVLDATATAFDTGLAAAIMAAGATVTDSWDVLAGGVSILDIDAADIQVTAGLGGYSVTMSAENLGVSPLTIDSVGLTFFGSADRTAEYTVTPVPGNPTTIAPMSMEILGFTVDVDLGATQELVVIDGDIQVTETPGGSMFADATAQTTDSWIVVGCAAPTCGDCSGDLVISIIDALTAAQHAAGLVTLTGVEFSNCNVTGTLEPVPGAVVDVLDALALAQAAAGLPIVLACC